ncbi:acetyl-CoA synthetase-like protein [Aspergillus tubingensis]|uniref:AMP dependent CoA ligase n=1 Tax=Aspergillus niger TaxID=5061 RepID=A0A117E345_ASPNG|nr:acetyl-CoA synthetase-like protein [Aspergillus tubingensis]GAQ44826.1 AMP dependent CoA ligase [Aspergillus niger]GFN11768.1 acetyl-CoA synthetase-like protein [Aspergillus tubingensis]
MIFSSTRPRLDVPTDVTIWDWLFESRHYTAQQATKRGGFNNAATGVRIGYKDVKAYSTFASTALVQNHGLRPGDTIIILSGIVAGASPAHGADELVYLLVSSRAKFIFTIPSCLSKVMRSADRVGIPHARVFLLEGRQDSQTTLQDCIDIGRSYGPGGQEGSFKILDGSSNRDSCGYLNFSSGTTGRPKAVMLSHHNIIAQCMQAGQTSDIENKKMLAVLPLYHGLIHLIHVPIMRDMEVLMLSSFTMESMLDTIVKHRITEVPIVPPMIVRLLNDPKVAQYDLSHVKTFSSGAAPIATELLRQLEKAYPGTGLKQSYGMTETCGALTTHSLNEGGYKYAHTVGTIMANTELRIVDTMTSFPLGYNAQGEIHARGPQIAMGYLGNDEATNKTFPPDGWLRTGDVGFIDSEGFLTITDRIKDMIKVKGIGVSPVELEDSLLQHPAVADAAVVGIPEEYSGQRPKAYVVMKGTSDSGATGEISWRVVGQELMELIRSQKVRHKWLSEVEFIDAIPKGPSGKILRRKLLERAEAEGMQQCRIVREIQSRGKL